MYVKYTESTEVHKCSHCASRNASRQQYRNVSLLHERKEHPARRVLCRREAAAKCRRPLIRCQSTHAGCQHAHANISTPADSAATCSISQQCQPWTHDVLLVDGTNVYHFAKSNLSLWHMLGERSWLDTGQKTQDTVVDEVAQCKTISKANPRKQQRKTAAAITACFLAWVKALILMTKAKQVYIVFDAQDPAGPNTVHRMNDSNACEETSQTASEAAADPEPHSSASRRELLPSYKQARGLKRHRKATQFNNTNVQRQGDSSTTAGVATGAKPTSAGQNGMSAGPSSRYASCARAAEALGCCIVWTPSGYEADDVLMSLTTYLAKQGGSSQSPPVPAYVPDVMQHTQHPPSISVASSDSDMLQLLSHCNTRVGWLELLQLPSTVMSSRFSSQGANQEPQQQHREQQQQERQQEQPQSQQSPAPMQSMLAKDVQDVHGHADDLLTNDHVVALETRAWDGICTWLPVRMHHAVQVSDLVPGKIAAIQMADYQALIGKKEAGVKGAGMSHKQAVGLLARHGSIKGIMQALQNGELNSRLQPVKSGNLKESATASTHNNTADKQQNLCSTAQEKMQGSDCPVASRDEKPTSVSSSTAAGEPLAGLLQAQANLQITKLRCDYAFLPIQRLRTYQAQHAGHAVPSNIQDLTTRQLQTWHVQQQRDMTQGNATQAATAVVMSHPVHYWRVTANARVLQLLQQGHGPAWAVNLLNDSSCTVAYNYSTPHGMLLDVALLPALSQGGVSNLATASSLTDLNTKASQASGAHQQLQGILLIGLADIHASALQQLPATPVIPTSTDAQCGSEKQHTDRQPNELRSRSQPGVPCDEIQCLSSLAAAVGQRTHVSQVPSKLKFAVRPLSGTTTRAPTAEDKKMTGANLQGLAQPQSELSWPAPAPIAQPTGGHQNCAVLIAAANRHPAALQQVQTNSSATDLLNALLANGDNTGGTRVTYIPAAMQAGSTHYIVQHQPSAGEVKKQLLDSDHDIYSWALNTTDSAISTDALMNSQSSIQVVGNGSNTITIAPAQTHASGQSSSLYVKNLHPEADELYLYQRFAPHGALLSCKIKIDPATGQCSGVGFVNYADAQSANRAMQLMHGSRGPTGRQLHITVQAPRVVRALAAAAASMAPPAMPTTFVVQAPATAAWPVPTY